MSIDESVLEQFVAYTPLVPFNCGDVTTT